MKKKSRIEIERKIVSHVKREMDKPRLTESVRNGFSAQAAAGHREACCPFRASLNPGLLPAHHSQLQFQF
jgi:hypothetical protein